MLNVDRFLHWGQLKNLRFPSRTAIVEK